MNKTKKILLSIGAGTIIITAPIAPIVLSLKKENKNSGRINNLFEENKLDSASSKKTFATQNDLINAIKGFTDNQFNNVKVGDIVQIGSQPIFKLTQDKFDELKMKNSY